MFTFIGCLQIFDFHYLRKQTLMHHGDSESQRQVNQEAMIKHIRA